jgi:predicted nucleic acid-binding protein
VEYVIDASVAVKWFIPEPQSDRAAFLLAEYRADRLDLIAPDVLIAEVGNTLWKRSVLRGEIASADAQAMYRDFIDLRIPLRSSSALAEAALAIAVAHHHSLYDALYIALALERKCDLISADRTLVTKLSKAFPLLRLL